MVTSLYASLLAMIFILLSVHVIRGRRQFRIAVSDGGNHEMRRRIRAQGNFAEYAPFFLILLGYVEHNGLTAYALHILGVLFTAGRLMHAYSLTKDEQYNDGVLLNNPRYRIGGMMCTFASLGLLAVILAIQYVQSIL